MLGMKIFDWKKMQTKKPKKKKIHFQSRLDQHKNQIMNTNKIYGNNHLNHSTILIL